MLQSCAEEKWKNCKWQHCCGMKFQRNSKFAFKDLDRQKDIKSDGLAVWNLNVILNLHSDTKIDKKKY